MKHLLYSEAMVAKAHKRNHHVRKQDTVELHSFETKIGYASFPQCDIRTILPYLTESFSKVTKEHGGPKTKDEEVIERGVTQRAELAEVCKADPTGPILHEYLWPRVGEFLREHDVVVGETGCSNFGLVNTPFPNNTSLLTQTLWGSIGWATACSMGAGLAAREAEQERRVLLFSGDGSMQLTLQEIGTMIRRKLNNYLFVLNNDGFEIERQIHGPQAEYNNIQMYDWQKMLPFFAGQSVSCLCGIASRKCFCEKNQQYSR